MRVIAVLLALSTPALAQGWERPPAADGHAYPDCYCSNRGERVELGATACLRVDGRRFTARCAMSQNSPAWRREAEGCAEGVSRAPAPPAPPASPPPARG